MTAPMTQDDDIVDLDSYSQEAQAEDYASDVDLEDYASSQEAQEASWWDVAKDVIIQPALGFAQAFTWPADVLKIGMVGEALTDLDELESAFEKAGKPFNRSEYVKSVSDQSQFIPTQKLLEDTFSAKTGISLEPKSETGKNIRKFFTLAGLLRGKGLGNAVKGGAVGAGTTAGLKAAGVNETASELLGDVAAGSIVALSKSGRVLSPEIQELEKTASKHGLPFPEYMTRPKEELVKPWINENQRMAAQKDLGMSSKEAIEQIIEGKLPIARLKNQGSDLDVITNDAYDYVKDLASKHKAPVPTSQIVKDADSEIARIKSLSPSPSDAEKAAINILETEKFIFKKATQESPERLIQQIKNYNANVSQIYRKPAFSGVEDEVRGAYAYLNNSIRNTIESEVGTDARQAMKTADALFAEKSKLDKVESLIEKSFINGDYNPKKLNSLLNSRQGQIVQREMGSKAIGEIKDIAKYGEEATKAVNQLAKSSMHLGNISEWGPIAGFLLHKIPKTAGFLLAARPLGNRVKGYLLMRPATREVYRDIVKNAAQGSYKTLAADFAKLNAAISNDFGSVEDFIKSMMDDLELYEGD